MQTKRIFLQTHEPIRLTFNQNKYDFIVQEVPSIKFSGKGNFFIMKIKKEYTSTWELIHLISEKLDISENLIGYAGLKDKNATTTQYISIPLNKSRDFELLNSKQIKVEETFLHNQKIKIGDLIGNKFKIMLKDVNPLNLPIIYQVLSQIQKNGMPNYFGYQRFGKDSDFEKTKAIVYGEEELGDAKLKSFLSSAYQSYFFNGWLATRIEISKQQNSNKLTILNGDIFTDKDKKTITGLMPGRKVARANDIAGELEKEFDDIFIHDKGYRRAAWIYPTDIKNKFNSEKNWLELQFTLPKSSYATVFIENITNQNYGY